MNFRQTTRDNWDVGVYVLLLGLILAWAVFMTCLSPLLGQTLPRAIVTSDPIPTPDCPPDVQLAGGCQTVVGYKIKKGLSETALADVADVPQPAWQDDAIEPATKYYFNIRGYDAVQDGLESIIVPFRFTDIQPAQITSFIATKLPVTTPGLVSVKISWIKVTKSASGLSLPVGSVVTYNIFVANTGTIQKLTVLQGTTLTVAGIRKGLTFYFYGTAVWNGVEGNGSTPVRVQM